MQNANFFLKFKPENNLIEIQFGDYLVSLCSKVLLFSFALLRISKNIPTTKDVEPLLEIDGDVRSFEVFLSSRMPVLAARDVEMFLPCTVNLDPKLREIIAGLYKLGPPMSNG